MRQRTIAEANAQKATLEAVKREQFAMFFTDMLKGVGPSVALGRDTTLLQEILDNTIQRMGQDLTISRRWKSKCASLWRTFTMTWGFSTEWKTAIHQFVHIPMQPSVDSLNVSAAAALLLYESFRKRAELF